MTHCSDTTRFTSFAVDLAFPHAATATLGLVNFLTMTCGVVSFLTLCFPGLTISLRQLSWIQLTKSITSAVVQALMGVALTGLSARADKVI